MMPASVACALRRNWMLYAAGLGMILCFKIYCQGAGAEALAWILSPTAKWVGLLGGIPFEKELHIGYINHAQKVIIVPSCSGVRFMTVVFATLLFPFVHRMRSCATRLGWLMLSLMIAYGCTLFANGIRIALSIRFRMPALSGWMPPDLLHTMEGMAVFFVALCAVYQVAAHLSRRWGGTQQKELHPLWAQLTLSCGIPALFYFSLTLGVPLLRGAYADKPGHFVAYTALMLAMVIAVVLAGWLYLVVKRRLKSE